MKLSVLFLLLMVLIAGCTSIDYIEEMERVKQTKTTSEEITTTETTQTTVPEKNVSENFTCEECFNGTITKITDGDTLEVGNDTIRLALVDAPEYYEDGYEEAKDFVSSICAIGSTAMVDEDDLQEPSFNRTVAVVYCGDKNLNEELLVSGHGVIDERFCDESEFGNEDWAKKYGC